MKQQLIKATGRLCAFWLAWVRCTCVVAMLCGVATASPPHEITLRFAVFDHPEAYDTLKQCLRDFECANPGISVKFEPGDYNTYFQKLFAQYAAGVAPDVAMLDVPNFDRFAKRRMLIPLNQFYCDTPEFDINAYYPEIVHVCTFNGELYVLPRDVASEGLIYYNKRAFDQAGIPYPDGTWTWDFQERPVLKEKDFLWVLHRLTKRDENGRVVRYAFLPDTEQVFADSLVYSQGLSYVDDSDHFTELRFSDPKVVKTYAFIADIYRKLGYMPTGREVVASQTLPQQYFADGRAAMYQCGIWQVKSIRDYMKSHPDAAFDWDITLAPGFKTGKQAWPTGGSGYAMLSTTTHPHEAWKLMQWMAGRPGMIAMARSGIAQPAIKTLARSEAWIPGPDTPPEERVPASRILTDVAVSHSVFSVRDQNWDEVSHFLNDHQGSINDGAESAQDGLQAVQDNGIHRLRDILREQNAPRFNWWLGGFFVAALLCALFGWVVLPKTHQVETRRQKQEGRVAFAFLSPWLLGLVIFVVGPTAISFLFCLTNWDFVSPPRWRGLGNFAEMFCQDPRFWQATTITTTYAALSTPLCLGFALLLALLLNRRPKGANLFRAVFVMPALVSPVALVIIWRKLFEADGGLVNALIYGPDGHRNLLGLGSLATRITGVNKSADWLGNDNLVIPAFVIMALINVGAALVILQAGIQSVPKEYNDVASLDAMRPWQRFRHCTLPVLAPYLLFLAIGWIVGSYQMLTQPYVITSGFPSNGARFFLYYLYDMMFTNFRVGYGAALAFMLLLLTGSLSAVQWKLSRRIYYEVDQD